MPPRAKRCTKCGGIKPVDEFHWTDKARGKRHAHCGTCRALARKKSLCIDCGEPARGRQCWKCYLATVRSPHDRKVCTKCGETKPIEEFYWLNAAKGRRHSRCTACFAAYREEHRDGIAAHMRRWRKANLDKGREHARRRRALKNGADGEHTDAEFMEKVEARDWICPECGERMTMPERGRIDGSKPADLTRDHIVPLSRGGSDDISNIRPLCRSCNSKKCDAGGLNA